MPELEGPVWVHSASFLKLRKKRKRREREKGNKRSHDD